MKKYNSQLIFVSAILFAILFNFRTVGYVLSVLDTKSFDELLDNEKFRIWIGIFNFVLHVLLFLILAFFNYSWRDKLTPPALSKTIKILLVVVVNILVLYVIAYLENAFMDYMLSDTDFVKKRRPHHHSVGYFLFANISIAGLAVSEAYLILLAQKTRMAEVENTRLKEENANAELAVLKEQISPHFFFNTLSSLSNVIRNEKKEVGLEFIQEMSKTYRYTLASKRQDLVPLKEELEFVKAYLFLRKKR